MLRVANLKDYKGFQIFRHIDKSFFRYTDFGTVKGIEHMSFYVADGKQSIANAKNIVNGLLSWQKERTCNFCGCRIGEHDSEVCSCWGCCFGDCSECDEQC